MGFKQFIFEASAQEIWEKHYYPRFYKSFSKARSMDSYYADWNEEKITLYLTNIMHSILANDPTFAHDYSAAGSAAPGKFFRPMCEWFLVHAESQGFSQAAAMFPNQIVKRYMKDYDEYNKWLPAQYKSITAFKTINDFARWASEEMPKHVEVAKKEKAYKESMILYEDAGTLVLVPRTHHASQYFGTVFGSEKGGESRWCTTWTDTNYFNQYAASGVLVMIMDKDDRTDSTQLYILMKTEKRSNHIDHYYMDWQDEVTDPDRIPGVLFAILRERYGEKFEECMTKVTEDWEAKVPEEEEEPEPEDEEPVYRAVVLSEQGDAGDSYFATLGFSGTKALYFELTPCVEAVFDHMDGDTDSIYHPLEVSMVLLGPSDMTDSIYNFPQINFNTWGAAIHLSEDLEQYVERVRNGFQNDGRYDDPNEARHDVLRGLAEACEEFYGSVSHVEHGPAGEPLNYLMLVSHDGSEHPSNTLWNQKLLQALPGSSYPGLYTDSPSEVGDFYLGNSIQKVLVYYDEDLGTLEDSLADSDFKRKIERHYYGTEAKKAGQKEFEFSEMSAPSESPEGIVKPMVLVEPAIPGRKRKKNSIPVVD